MKKLEFQITKRGSKDFTYEKVEWDLSNQLDIDVFLKENPNFSFKKAGKIVENPESVCGFKLQMSEEFKEQKFVIYLLVIDGKIVKGGKSKNPLTKRSYYAGTEKNWTEKGTPSATNYIYSQIFRKCLKENINVDFYCFATPFKTEKYDVFGVKKTFDFSPYEEYEKVLNSTLKKKLGRNLIGEGKLTTLQKK